MNAVNKTLSDMIGSHATDKLQWHTSAGKRFGPKASLRTGGTGGQEPAYVLLLLSKFGDDEMSDCITPK